MTNQIKQITPNSSVLGSSLVIFAACAFVQIIAIGSLPLLPFIGLDLHISIPNMQLLIPVYLSGIIVSQFIISFNAEIYGRRLIYLLSLVTAVLGLIFWMVAKTRWELYCAIFLEAFGVGGLLSLNNAIIKDLFPPESHSRLFGIVTIIMWLTAIFAPLASGYLQKYIGWRYTIGVYCSFAVTLLVFAYFILPETSPKQSGQNPTIHYLIRQSYSLFGSKIFLGSALIGGAINAIPTAYNTLAPFLFVNIYSLPAQTVGDYLMIPGIGILLGLICSEMIGNHVGHLTLIRIGVYLSVLASLGLLFLGLKDSSINIVVVLFIISIAMFAMGLVTPHYWSAALGPIKDISAVASSVIVLMQQIFAMFTGFFISMLAATSVMPMDIIITSLSIVALFCSLFLLPRE